MSKQFISEKEKYEYGWDSSIESNSRTALSFAKFIEGEKLTGSMLDLGCGNGLVVTYLRYKGFDCYGCDTTLKGLDRFFKEYTEQKLNPLLRVVNLADKRQVFKEASLDNLPFPDNSFDYTFSCDVLEHIPTELVPKVISEIIRVTKIKTYHVIATFNDFRGGIEWHPTVKGMIWWNDQFYIQNNQFPRCKIYLQSRKDFLFKTEGRRERGL